MTSKKQKIIIHASDANLLEYLSYRLRHEFRVKSVLTNSDTCYIDFCDGIVKSYFERPYIRDILQDIRNHFAKVQI